MSNHGAGSIALGFLTIICVVFTICVGLLFLLAIGLQWDGIAAFLGWLTAIGAIASVCVGGWTAWLLFGEG